MLVKEFNRGATKIRIHDDYCVPREEVPAILKKIGEDAYRALCAKEQKDNETA